MTMAGVAAAFDVQMMQDQRLLAVLSEKLGISVSKQADVVVEDLDGFEMRRQTSSEAACHKLALVPEGALVEWPDDGNPWPLVSMRNVYIFAGMPPTFRTMFQRAAEDGRFEGARRWVNCTLWLDATEEEVLDSLNTTVDVFPLVEIGSYPSCDVDAGRRRLSITFEAFDEDQLKNAWAHFKGQLPPEIVVEEDDQMGNVGNVAASK